MRQKILRHLCMPAKGYQLMGNRAYSSGLLKWSGVTPNAIVRIRQWGYLIIAVPLLLPWVSVVMGRYTGQGDLWAWLTIGFVYLLIPLVDWLIGEDRVNANELDEQTRMKLINAAPYFKWLPIVCLPIYLGALAWSTHIFVTNPLHWTWLGMFGWLLSLGTIGVVLGINVAHELVHKDSRLEQWCGGIYLSLVTYAGFKVEHVRGNHVNVSTPLDASSARYNQSLYHFWPRAMYHNVRNAFVLEAKRLVSKGVSPWHWRNELIWWYGLSVLWASACFMVWGWVGVAFFIAQGFIAALLLETVNYLEHYGLHRRQLDNGRYERTTHLHSWNSGYLLTNLFLFQLQRHSDHHANPKRRYQDLVHHDDSPQLPAGYAAMVVLAFIPPLWRRVMNPRVQAYYGNSFDH